MDMNNKGRSLRKLFGNRDSVVCRPIVGYYELRWQVLLNYKTSPAALG